MKENQTMEIRPFYPSQQSGVLNHILAIQRDEFGIPITAEDQPDLADIPGVYQRGCGNFWVAAMDGKILGTIALIDIGNHQAALRKMFVHQKWRGREKGVAKGLLSILLEWSGEKRIRELFLGTTQKFLAAHRFYEKNGFEEIRQDLLPTSFPLMAVDTKFYRYQIPGDGAASA